MMKVKILLVGSVGDNVLELVKKLNSLQESKAGPFDACFCVGPCSSSIKNHAMPLPVYLQDCSNLILPTVSNPGLPDGITRINENLFGLQGSANQHVASIWNISLSQTEITVASVPSHARLDSTATNAIQETLSHVSYVGCDLLLTSEFPQGIDILLPPDCGEQGSFDIANIALRSRSRYHISPYTFFFQSDPFTHLMSSSSTFNPKHIGRFISLAPVVSAAVAKEKGKPGKFIHALGIIPLHQMTVSELELKPDNLKPCPFTDDNYEVEKASVGTLCTATSGLSEAQARRLMASHTLGHDYRWSKKRKGAPEHHEVDESISTLFLHGLHKDVSGHLQTATGALLQAFQKYGISKIRRPPTSSSYAFLEFDSHSAARLCLEQTAGEIMVSGVHLMLKWGTPGNKSLAGLHQKKHRLTEAEAVNSPTLYFCLPQTILAEEIVAASKDLKQLTEETLEKALGDPNVTAANEPALQVMLRIVDKSHNYGFLDFASHAAASMALASLTGSTNGGPLNTENKEGPKISEILRGTNMFWAPAKINDESHMIETASGIKFERQHFPADSRTDCWFCLASPTCEKHLITSVHNQCYVSMPKGPIHKEGHVLIVPVAHTSQGALSDPYVSTEIDTLKQQLRLHAVDVWNMDLFVFERAIQTRGGYHTHVQCIPIPKHTGRKLQATMMEMAKASGFPLRELNSDIGLAAMTKEGYFYAEIPVSKSECKRFLYHSGAGKAVPLQFGREVLAAVLDNPDFAHWKACILPEAEEADLAMKFRESFSKYASN